MTKKERAALLRDRAALRGTKRRQKPPGLYRARHPKAPDRRETAPRSAFLPFNTPPKVCIPWGDISGPGRAPLWMKIPDDPPKDDLEAQLPSGMEIAAAIEEKWAGLILPKLDHPFLPPTKRTQG